MVLKEVEKVMAATIRETRPPQVHPGPAQQHTHTTHRSKTSCCLLSCPPPRCRRRRRRLRRIPLLLPRAAASPLRFIFQPAAAPSRVVRDGGRIQRPGAQDQEPGGGGRADGVRLGRVLLHHACGGRHRRAPGCH
ncbi:hypothetical protein ACQ4PT_024888 [Festuca glaucescens]